MIAELTVSQQQVAELLASMAAVQDWQREPAEWSFRYLAAHLVSVERECHLRRVMGIASGGQPYFHHYMAHGVDFGDADLEESLEEWRAARTQLLDFVSALPDETLDYTGTLEACGDMTLLDALEELVEQDQGQMRHVRQLIADFFEERVEYA